MNAYETIDATKPIICDLFYQREGEDSRAVINGLKSVGYEEYAIYHRWMCTAPKKILDDMNDSIKIRYGHSKEVINKIKENFDTYSDNLPEDGEIEKYFEDKQCYTIVESEKREVIGVIVITIKGKVQTEDFVFVNPEYRAQGLAGKLHSHWYGQVEEAHTQFVAWIRDDNFASIKLHTKFGYTRQDTFKITMKKGN